MMNSKPSSVILQAALVIGVLGSLVACGPSSTNKTNIGGLSPEEQVKATLKESLGSSYSPEDEKNAQLAQRFEGGSALIHLEGTGDDRKAHIQVNLLVQSEEQEIVGEGTLDPKKNMAQPTQLQPLTVAAANSAKYSLDARCLTILCEKVIVLMTEHDQADPAAATSTSAQAAQAAKTEGSAAVNTVDHRFAMIFRVPRAEKRADAEKLMTADTPAAANLFWSASPVPGQFMRGGGKNTIEQARVSHARLLGAAANGGKPEGGAPVVPVTPAPETAPITTPSDVAGTRGDNDPAVSRGGNDSGGGSGVAGVTLPQTEQSVTPARTTLDGAIVGSSNQ